jgi:hypothetical protein
MKLYSYSPFTEPKIEEIELIQIEDSSKGIFLIKRNGFREYASIETYIKDPKYAKSPKEAIEKRIEIQKSIIKREQEYLDLALKDLKEVE